jgi:hypothetical protein
VFIFDGEGMVTLPRVKELVGVSDKGADSHRTPLPNLTINEWNLPIAEFRFCADRIHRFLGSQRSVGSSPKLSDGSVFLGEIAVNNAVAEAIDEFIALGHLESREESVIATVDGIGSDNHFLLADSHNLGIHNGMALIVISQLKD